jgi:hypothetical protein
LFGSARGVGAGHSEARKAGGGFALAVELKQEHRLRRGGQHSAAFLHILILIIIVNVIGTMHSHFLLIGSLGSG